MTEVEVLIRIDNTLKLIAASLGGISTALWLMLLFKNMSK